jgi:hypothetical protein
MNLNNIWIPKEFGQRKNKIISKLVAQLALVISYSSQIQYKAVLNAIAGFTNIVKK